VRTWAGCRWWPEWHDAAGEEAVGWLARRGYAPQFGARPLRRAIQREVDNRLSRLLLDGRLRSGQRVVVGVRDGDLDLEVDDVRDAAAAQA
jgi:ATP-dependent Clp protease ATP-binding subunit ClpC